MTSNLPSDVPKDQHEALQNFNAFPLTAIDKQILSMTDEEFRLTSWEELKEIISSNRLELLKRRPSDLRRYMIWSSDIKARYQGMTNFVIQERLHWDPLPSDNQNGATASTTPRFAYKNPVPFAHEDDFKILRNDWPYGLAPNVTHLCIWTKTPIAVDPSTGDVTAESRDVIERFVRQTFSNPLDGVFGDGEGKEHVLWFKNWVSLQSVRGVDHIHVLLRDVSKSLIDGWTGSVS